VYARRLHESAIPYHIAHTDGQITRSRANRAHAHVPIAHSLTHAAVEEGCWVRSTCARVHVCTHRDDAHVSSLVELARGGHTHARSGVTRGHTHARSGVTRGHTHARSGVTRGHTHARSGVTRGLTHARSGVTRGHTHARSGVTQGRTHALSTWCG
jgi:hypothetical protein